MTATSGRQRPRPPEASLVVPYDPSWPARFELIRGRVAPLLRVPGATVEHVGSTAVPGLAAKPIIDVDVVVATSADIELALRDLASGGYLHVGDLGIPGREAFDVPTDMPYYHLYLVAHGSRPHLDHVLLRDHLRSHPEAARRYQARKLAVAHLLERGDRAGYLAAKSDLIAELLAEAMLPG